MTVTGAGPTGGGVRTDTMGLGSATGNCRDGNRCKPTGGGVVADTLGLGRGGGGLARW